MIKSIDINIGQNTLLLLNAKFYFLGLDCPVTMKYTESPI